MSRIILGNIFGANGSVNFYMFHGGTNFGFMNGANILGYSGLKRTAAAVTINNICIFLKDSSLAPLMFLM